MPSRMMSTCRISNKQPCCSLYSIMRFGLHRMAMVCATIFYHICFLCVLSLATADFNERKSCGEITEITQLDPTDQEQADDDDEDDYGDETRVRMGTAVTTKRYPWMIAIKRKGVGVIGGGALIAKQYVLSAAHCFFTRRRKGPRPSEYKFYIGFLDLSQKPIKGRQQIFGASKIHMHATFDFQQHTDDIALIRLEKPVPDKMFQYKYARTICLPQVSNLALHNNFIVAGWGNNGTKEINSVPNLFEAMVDLYQGLCPKNNICTQSRPSDVCENDSGGPLMQPKKNGRMQIVGIVSHGPSCADDEETGKTPGIFTDVRKYMGWIKEKIDSDEKASADETNASKR